MDIPVHQITALIGPSGCGKSTFLKTLNRMNDLVPGVHIEGTSASKGRTSLTRTWTSPGWRKQIGMVFQKANPFPMSIYDNVAYGPRTHGIRNRTDLDAIVEKSLRDAAIWGRGQGPSEEERPGPLRRPAAAAVHCPALANEPEVLLDGRVHLRPGPHFHLED